MSVNCSDDIPKTEIYYQDIGAAEIVLLVVGGILAILSLVIFFEEVFYINRNYACSQRKNKTFWLLGTFPVYTMTCLIGMLIPTSLLFCDLVSSGYTAVSLYAFLSLMFLYYGSKTNMIEYCQTHDKQIALRSPPVACCCCCLPQLIITEHNLNVIKWFVLQASFVMPAVKFAIAVLWADERLVVGHITPSGPNFYLTIIGTVSTLMAMYGIVIIFRVSKDSLQHQKLKPKFLMFPLTMLVANLQSALFGVFARVGWIECVGAISAKTRASYFHHFALLVEMFLLGLLMRFAYRRPDAEVSLNFSLLELKNPTENTSISISKQPKYVGDNQTFTDIDGTL